MVLYSTVSLTSLALVLPVLPLVFFILQLILYLETKRRRFLSSERRLLDKLHAYEVEKQKYRRW